MSFKPEPDYWRLRYLNPWYLAIQTWRAFNDNQLHARCAQFAFYSMLGFVPLLIVTISGIAMLPIDGALESLLVGLRRILPADAFTLVQTQIDSIQRSSSTGLILVNVGIFIFAGARLFITISEGLNVAYGAPPRHRRIRAIGLSSVMPLIYVLLLLAALVLMLLIPVVVHVLIWLLELEQLRSSLLQALRWVVVSAFLLIITATMYGLIPANRPAWRWITPGSLFAVGGWLLLSQAFRIYFDNFGRYNTTFGTLGGVIAMLLWLYLTGAMLFVGGQINGVILCGGSEKSNDEPRQEAN
jgi:membrane protein